MKETKTCPKCDSQDIVRVPGRVGAYAVGNNIVVADGFSRRILHNDPAIQELLGCFF